MGAPAIRVIASEERHATVDRALRLLGHRRGRGAARRRRPERRDRPRSARRALATGADAPTIVCVQAGNVNTGACDDLGAAASWPRGRGAWATSTARSGCGPRPAPPRRSLVGIERADSWAVDGHKWLNVPTTRASSSAPTPRRSARRCRTPRLPRGSGRGRRGGRPTSSRVLAPRRGFATWAALRELGRDGVAELVDRCCALARRFGERLGRSTASRSATRSSSTRCW